MRSNALIPYPCNDFAAPPVPASAPVPTDVAAALLRLTAFTAKKKICYCQSMTTLRATGNWLPAIGHWLLAAGW